MLSDITKHIHNDFSGRYHEPFMGAAAVFLSLAPRRAVLSDSNRDLVDMLRYVVKNPELVYSHLLALSARHSIDSYYEIREQFNRIRRASCMQAARFIYLNKASFNGIYRVNTQGMFNVPSGKRATVALPTWENFRSAARLFASAEIYCRDFVESISEIGRGDLVYFDPPYPPLSDSAFFTHYTKERFSLDDHIRLAEAATQLRKKGALVIISNADTPYVRNLYRDWQLQSIPKTRWVTSSKVKHKVNELIIVGKPVKESAWR